MAEEETGDGVEAAALPAPLTGIFGNGSRDGFDPGPGRRLLQDANADAFRGAGRWGSSAGMGGNSVRGERGGFVPAEAAAEDDDGFDWADPESFRYGSGGAGGFSGAGYSSISTGGYGGSSEIYVVDDDCGDSSDCSDWTEDGGEPGAGRDRSSLRSRGRGGGTASRSDRRTGSLRSGPPGPGSGPPPTDRLTPSARAPVVPRRRRRRKAYRYRICLFIQMELCRPSTLADWIRRRNSADPAAAAGVLLPRRLARDAADAAVQIARGLAHVHSCGVVHRDLKPSNVFASYDGDGSDTSEGGDCGGIPLFKIGDFGLSKLLACVPKGGTAPRPGQEDGIWSGRFGRWGQVSSTASGPGICVYGRACPLLLTNGEDGGGGDEDRPIGRDFGDRNRPADAAAATSDAAIPPRRDLDYPAADPLTAGVGTASYAAPEQVATSTYGPEADVFSLGLILLELFVPFGSEHERAEAFGRCRMGGGGGRGGGRAAAMPAEIRARHPRVADLVEACVDPDPRERPTAREVARAMGGEAAAIRRREDAARKEEGSSTRGEGGEEEQYDGARSDAAAIIAALSDLQAELRRKTEELGKRDDELAERDRMIEELRGRVGGVTGDAGKGVGAISGGSDDAYPPKIAEGR